MKMPQNTVSTLKWTLCLCFSLWKFYAKIRNQTEDFYGLALGLPDDSEVEISDVLGEDDNMIFIVRI